MDTNQINNHNVLFIMFYTKSSPLSSLLYSHRQYKKMVDMGILDITYDVCTKCHGK
jgi:hypothetical protein